MTIHQEITTLRELFTAIRDERRTHANTATRIGSAFLALLDYLADAPFIRKDQEDTDGFLLRLLKGAVIGAIVMGLSETFISAYISSAYKDAVVWAIFIVFILIRPKGMFPAQIAEKV